MRSPRRFPSLTLATLLAAGLALGSPVRAHAAAWDGKPVRSDAAIEQSCNDFLFVGVRGSGEPEGFGQTVTGVRDGLAERWKRKGSVRQVWLDYPAVPPQTLSEVPFEDLLFKQPMPETQYFNSAREGSVQLIKVLDDSMKRCPNERIVLAGFSQGAQVITRALAETRPGDKLLAAILLGNPSHYPGQNVRELDGDASAEAIGMGAYLTLMRETAAAQPDRQKAVEAMLKQAFDLSEGKGDKTEMRESMQAVNAEIPPEAYPRTYSVCLAGDMICDSSEPMGTMLVGGSTMAQEIDRTRPIHLNYKDEHIQHTLDQVAGEINQATPIASATPVFVAGPFRIQQVPGRPNWRLTAGVGLGGLTLGCIFGLLVGRANGKHSATRAFRRRMQALEDAEELESEAAVEGDEGASERRN